MVWLEREGNCESVVLVEYYQSVMCTMMDNQFPVFGYCHGFGGAGVTKVRWCVF